ncbi:hypothetical protein IMZ48_12060 [Candidatus Bathyarchaeota archaeon]|nr:hypothetical protein [Candidatus Bathyarchaeota archaeon]
MSMARAFEIRWREEDLCLLETHPQTPGAPAASGIDCESPSRSTETSGTSQEEKDGDGEDGGEGGISRGAVAGIAVGVTFLAVFLCAAAFFIWYRKRNLKPPPTTPEDVLNGERTSGGATPSGPQEMEAYGKLQQLTPAAEMDGNADSIQE